MSSIKFLQSVLGNDGAQALMKAAERAPVLDTVLVPRTIVAWLGTAIMLKYEGEIPGLDNSYIALNKTSDSTISGMISLGDFVHSFENESVLHVAAAVGVALGVHGQKLDPALRGIELSKLGKSIDLLVKARLTANLLSDTLTLEKKIGDILPGRETAPGSRSFDYSHALAPEHRAAGYAMHINHTPAGTLAVSLHHNGQLAGHAEAEHNPQTNAIEIGVSDVNDEHQGKGLGSAMYEGLMAHGKHHLGAQFVTGGVHSSMASKVHQRLSAKHGMDYKPTPTPFPHLASPTPGPHDAHHGPYNYALKQEMPGQAAPPRGPDEAQMPQVPMKQQQMPKLGKTQKRELRVTKSESERKCPECGGHQFKQKVGFVGCLCFRGLAKSVKTSWNDNGDYFLKFIGSEWDDESMLALISVLKR